MRAAIYCRISKDKGGEALGVARQEEDCRKLCAARGWEVAVVLVDNDLSAYSGKPRPAYEQLLAAIRDGEIDALVAWDPDRLHRSPRELETFIALVEKHATAIATVNAGNLDLATASGRMVARMLGAAARHESEHKSERIISALAQNARAGKRHGGARPFGFEADGVTIFEPEAAMIRDAATRILAGETATGIAREWNAEGVLTPQRRSKWAPGPVRAMLVAPRLAGLRASHGEIMGDAIWDPIIDRATHERLVVQLARKSRPGRPAAYLLSNIARCGALGDDGKPCGGPLWGSKSGQRVRYICHNGPGRDGCGRISVVAGQLDEYVRDATIIALTGDGGAGLAAARRRHAGNDERQRTALAERDAADARLHELASDYGDGLMTRTEWLTGREAAGARMTAAQKIIDSGGGGGVLGTLRSKPEEMEADWAAADVAWRRAVIGLVIERIVIHPATGRGPKLEEDRVEIMWRS
jgi:site-specific DNA recombinase